MRNTILIVILNILAALACAGCGLLDQGPQSIQNERPNYNEVIRKTSRDQVFDNIVRVYNDDVPQFIDITGVNAQLQFTGSVSAMAMLPPSAQGGGSVAVTQGGSSSGQTVTTKTLGFHTGHDYTLSGSASWEEQPTITYQPLQGQALVSQISTPITVDTIVSLYDSGWPIDAVLEMAADRLTERKTDQPMALNAILDLDRLHAIALEGVNLGASGGSTDASSGNSSTQKSDTLVIHFQAARDFDFPTVNYDPLELSPPRKNEFVKKELSQRTAMKFTPAISDHQDQYESDRQNEYKEVEKTSKRTQGLEYDLWAILQDIYQRHSNVVEVVKEEENKVAPKPGNKAPTKPGNKAPPKPGNNPATGPASATSVTTKPSSAQELPDKPTTERAPIPRAAIRAHPTHDSTDPVAMPPSCQDQYFKLRVELANRYPRCQTTDWIPSKASALIVQEKIAALCNVRRGDFQVSKNGETWTIVWEPGLHPKVTVSDHEKCNVKVSPLGVVGDWSTIQLRMLAASKGTNAKTASDPQLITIIVSGTAGTATPMKSAAQPSAPSPSNLVLRTRSALGVLKALHRGENNFDPDIVQVLSVEEYKIFVQPEIEPLRHLSKDSYVFDPDLVNAFHRYRMLNKKFNIWVKDGANSQRTTFNPEDPDFKTFRNNDPFLKDDTNIEMHMRMFDGIWETAEQRSAYYESVVQPPAGLETGRGAEEAVEYKGGISDQQDILQRELHSLIASRRPPEVPKQTGTSQPTTTSAADAQKYLRTIDLKWLHFRRGQRTAGWQRHYLIIVKSTNTVEQFDAKQSNSYVSYQYDPDGALYWIQKDDVISRKNFGLIAELMTMQAVAPATTNNPSPTLNVGSH